MGHFHLTNARVHFKTIIGDQKNTAKSERKRGPCVELLLYSVPRVSLLVKASVYGLSHCWEWQLWCVPWPPQPVRGSSRRIREDLKSYLGSNCKVVSKQNVQPGCERPALKIVTTFLHDNSSEKCKMAPEKSFCVDDCLKAWTAPCLLLHWSGELFEQSQGYVLPKRISVVTSGIIFVAWRVNQK